MNSVGFVNPDVGMSSDMVSGTLDLVLYLAAIWQFNRPLCITVLRNVNTPPCICTVWATYLYCHSFFRNTAPCRCLGQVRELGSSAILHGHRHVGPASRVCWLSVPLHFLPPVTKIHLTLKLLSFIRSLWGALRVGYVPWRLE
jgi:hypothetical protein